MTIETTNKPLRQAGIYVIVVAASVALTLGSLRAFPQLITPALIPENTTTVEVAPIAIPTSPNNQSPNFVAAAVNRVGDAVVRIDTERTVAANNRSSPFFDDPFFRDFFGRDVFPQMPQEYRQQGQGSGFIAIVKGLFSPMLT